MWYKHDNMIERIQNIYIMQNCSKWFAMVGTIIDDYVIKEGTKEECEQWLKHYENCLMHSCEIVIQKSEKHLTK